jgi:hypothetical protein
VLGMVVVASNKVVEQNAFSMEVIEVFKAESLHFVALAPVLSKCAI